MDQGRNVGARPGDAERPQESGTAAPGRGGRMSRQRKTAAVLRLLRGEDLELDTSNNVTFDAVVIGALLFALPAHWI